MDCTFPTEQGRFNYRVCAVILSDDRLLAMRDERSPYYYLPGGRVTLHETAEDAVLRELREELGITAEILRPLWLNQSFFTEVVNGERYHELCLYFLVDVSRTELLQRGSAFTRSEGTHTLRFRWLPFKQLKDEYLYPMFIKKEIFRLPAHLTLRTETQ